MLKTQNTFCFKPAVDIKYTKLEKKFRNAYKTVI